MRVELDQERCCGAGQCALRVPEVFDQRDTDAVGLVLVPEPPEELWERVRDAANRCPAVCITLVE